MGIEIKIVEGHDGYDFMWFGRGGVVEFVLMANNLMFERSHDEM